MKKIAVAVGAAFALAGVLTFVGLYFPMSEFIKNEVRSSLEDVALEVVETAPQFLSIAAIEGIWDEGRYWEEIPVVEDIARDHSVENIYFVDIAAEPWVFLWALTGFEQERFPEGGDWRDHLYYYDDPSQVPVDLRRAVDLRTRIISSNSYTTEYGSFISLWKPVMDGSGKMIGILGIDKEASAIQASLQRLLILTLLPLAGFTLAGFIIALFVWRRIARPLAFAASAAGALERGEPLSPDAGAPWQNLPGEAGEIIRSLTRLSRRSSGA